MEEENWENLKEFNEAFSDSGCEGYREFMIDFISDLLKSEKEKEYKKGYNQCLKDQKLTGEKYQHLYL